MTNAHSLVTLHRWKLVELYKHINEALDNSKTLFGNIFGLTTNSLTQFALFYTPNEESWKSDKFGIVLKSIGGMQQIKLDLKVWFENQQGQKFGEQSVKNQELKNVDDRCEFNGLVETDKDSISAIYNGKENLFFCCEITDLSDPIDLLSLAFKDGILSNNWALFEEDIHDAIIKIGNTEFRVLKSCFMAQSPVFKRIFLSNFKESETSTIEIKDVDEKTMKQMIKWVYSGQIDDKNDMESLFKAADKYGIDLLKEFCIQSILVSLNTSNVLPRLILSVMHNEDVLKEACLNWIDNMAKVELSKCLTSSEWFDLVSKDRDVAEEVSTLINEKLEK